LRSVVLGVFKLTRSLTTKDQNICSTRSLRSGQTYRGTVARRLLLFVGREIISGMIVLRLYHFSWRIALQLFLLFRVVSSLPLTSLFVGCSSLNRSLE